MGMSRRIARECGFPTATFAHQAEGATRREVEGYVVHNLQMPRAARSHTDGQVLELQERWKFRANGVHPIAPRGRGIDR
jgi:hypothetical protein